MGKLTELEQWDEDVYQIETSDPVLGGPEGITNKPAKQLANRTQWLKKHLEDTNNALAEHEKSRNHPDATLTAKGFVRLYSGVTSLDETMAATPKAVKIAMDNANERLAKARNLADLLSIPLALANLTLADVKKYVESTNTGVSKLPTLFLNSEDDLTSLPAGYMVLAKNKTPGGPLPGDAWYYLEVAGNLDNPLNSPNRKGATIRITSVATPEISWMGVKFDDGTTTTAKFTWAKDFNTLNKPTPEDVGLAATKKAIDDTQTGLAAQGVMWISTADDLSNLPSGARRFARNNTGVTVLPAAGYFFLEVLAKRDTANGSCILATSDTRDVWIGFRYTVPDEAGFTWIQLNQNVENLGLTEAVKQALNAVQKTGDTMTGNLFLKNDARMHFVIVNEDGNARMWLYKDKGGDGVRLNNGVDGGGEFVFGKNGDFYSPLAIHAGAAALTADGNIYGSLWGGWLNNWLNSQFVARDNNINARATVDWVRQNFLSGFRLGAVESAAVWRAYGYNDTPPYVITGATNFNTDDVIDSLSRRPLQMYINGWRNIDWL